MACLAALRQAADAATATGDGRSRDQVMADTLVERVTGQAAATDVTVEVGIVIPVDALTDPDGVATGEVVGHGPLPGGIVADLLRTSRGKRWSRRLFSHPAHGTLVGGDPKRRFFDGFLAQLIDLRDGGRCRDRFCDAPIRHHDHIIRSRAGGPTSRRGSTPIGGVGCAPGATTSARCPAGRSRPSPTGSATPRTPCRPPPRPAARYTSRAGP